MKNSMNFFDKTFQLKTYERMVKAAEKIGLLDTLVAMQTEQGADPVQAEELARVCMAAVASCESIREAVSENPQPVLDHFLNHLRTKPGEGQDLILHKLYFGFTAHLNEETAEALAEGVSAEELFWRYYTEQQETAAPLPVEELEQKVKQAAAAFDLSPRVMKALTRKMAVTGDYLGTTAAVSETGTNYKCIVAMELYLNNKETMTIHEAANMACTGVEARAAAEKLAGGFITRETAKKILVAVSIAAVIIGVGILLYNAGAAMAAAKTAAAIAEVVQTASTVELPAIFAGFATTTTATGAPATYALGLSEQVVSALTATLKAAAMKKVTIGAVVAAVGAAMAVLSDHTASLLGKLSVKFSKDQTPVVGGLQMAAQMPAELPGCFAERNAQTETMDLIQWEDEIEEEEEAKTVRSF